MSACVVQNLIVKFHTWRWKTFGGNFFTYDCACTMTRTFIKQRAFLWWVRNKYSYEYSKVYSRISFNNKALPQLFHQVASTFSTRSTHAHVNNIIIMLSHFQLCLCKFSCFLFLFSNLAFVLVFCRQRATSSRRRRRNCARRPQRPEQWRRTRCVSTQWRQDYPSFCRCGVMLLRETKYE